MVSITVTKAASEPGVSPQRPSSASSVPTPSTTSPATLESPSTALRDQTRLDTTFIVRRNRRRLSLREGPLLVGFGAERLDHLDARRGSRSDAA